MRLLRTWLYKIRCVQVCCVLSSETKHYVLNRHRSAATKCISSYLGYKYIVDCQWLLVTFPRGVVSGDYISFFFKFLCAVGRKSSSSSRFIRNHMGIHRILPPSFRSFSHVRRWSETAAKGEGLSSAKINASVKYLSQFGLRGKLSSVEMSTSVVGLSQGTPIDGR